MRKIFGSAFVAILAIAWLLQSAMAADPERISPVKLKSIMKTDNNVIVVDTRAERSYKSGHIPGALSMVYSDGIRAGAKILPKDKMIILYCA